jgi:hypothetical protein
VLIKDAIADITLQQVLTRAEEFDVVATLNLNGDYLSDALAAQVGGIGIAPGANINYQTGHAVFEATHGTAPKYADLDKVNPGSVILSGEMMLRYMGWVEAADAIIAAMDKTIGQKTVTYDFARMMAGARPRSSAASSATRRRNPDPQRIPQRARHHADQPDDDSFVCRCICRTRPRGGPRLHGRRPAGQRRVHRLWNLVAAAERVRGTAARAL